MSTLRVNTITPQSGSLNQLSGSLLVTNALTVSGASAFVNATFTQLLTGTTFSGSAATFSGNVTAATLTGTLSTAAQTNITSVGTLSSLTVSGNVTVDTNTLFVDATNNAVSVGTTSLFPYGKFQVWDGASWVQNANGDGVRVRTFGRSSSPSIFGLPNGAATIVAIGEGIAIPLGIGTFGAEPLIFGTNSTEKMRLDTSGNLGLGVTPTNNTLGKTIQVGQSSQWVSGASTNNFWLASNWYFDSGDKYIGNGYASLYSQQNGEHQWKTAGNNTSGAGATISPFTQAMTLDANGDWYIDGGTSRGRVFVTPAGSVNTLYSNLTGFGEYSTLRLRAIDMQFYTGAVGSNAERARITSGGYFKASPDGSYVNSTGTFHEFTTTAAADAAMLALNNNASCTAAIMSSQATRNTTNTSFYFFSCFNRTASANKLLIADSGDVTNTNGSYTAISDIKLKQDVIDAPSQWDDIKATRFRKYRFKADVERLGDDAPYLLGVVAQELEQTSPGCIDEHPDYEEQEVVDDEGNVTTQRVKVGVTKSFKQSVYLMKAAVALQEAMARIEALEARLEALEA